MKIAQVADIEQQINVLQGDIHALIERVNTDIPLDQMQIITQDVQNKIQQLNRIKQVQFSQMQEEIQAQETIQNNTQTQNSQEMTGMGIYTMKNKKMFNLKKAQTPLPPMGPPPMDPMGIKETPSLNQGPIMEEQEAMQDVNIGLVNLKDGADLRDQLDQMDYNSARSELLLKVEDVDASQKIEDGLHLFYEGNLDNTKRLEIAMGLFELLPDNMKEIDINDESIVFAPYKPAEINEIIEKLAKECVNKRKQTKKEFNLKKTAQHKSVENAIMWGPSQVRVDPFLRQPASDWSIVERNKGFGLVVDDVWDIDYEAIWRGTIMDKYSRPYKDKEGNWVGGYVNKRFEVDRNIPATSNLQLKPGQKRRPILPEYGNTESRLEAAREKGTITGKPVVEGKPFNWKDAQSKKKS